ncbi:MAG TPA: hypothetical protein VNB64_12840 [Solirubrobacteraceae bacterium]|nr:hypothetical protein [Solirubrobacteraceae bacterium]
MNRPAIARAIAPIATALAALAVAAPAGGQSPCVPGLTCPPANGGGGTAPPPSGGGGGGQTGGTSPGAGTTGGTATTPVASAANPEVGIEDTNVVFGPMAAQVAATWRAIGVDYVRIQAFWDAISPATASPTMPAGFDPSNPSSPGYNWGQLDAAVEAVRRNGLRIMLTVNQSGPRWASLQPAVDVKSWRPNPRRYAQFASALARRYGTRVDRYLVGSEPNQRVFLAPQFTCVGRACTPSAPHQYRNLLNAAYPAIKAADPGAQILIGELAPIGSPPSATSGLTPMLFIRELACVDSRFRRLTATRCRRFRAVRGDGFGYHPYVNNKTPPNVPQRNPELAKIGDLPRLLRVLDRLTAAGRLRASTGRFRLYLTEFGYITNPPNPRFGVSLALQARYLAQSAYIVWRLRSRVKLITQYQWNDDGVFPTGLHFISQQPKPSFFQYPNPFWIDTTRGLARAVFWGQVRPDAQRRITLQVRPRGTSSFRTAATATTDAGGYWSRTLRAIPGATYRFQYTTRTGVVATQSLAAPRG